MLSKERLNFEEAQKKKEEIDLEMYEMQNSMMMKPYIASMCRFNINGSIK